jgi:hypothetical protein
MKAEDNKDSEAFLKSTGEACATIEVDHGKRGIEVALSRRKEQEQQKR